MSASEADDDAFTARMRARVGTTLRGRYQLGDLIGIGGMASVYRGAHRNGNPVAIKVLHPELSAIADVRARFLREGYVANKVKHRGSVRVLDDDVADDGSAFLVMELLEGETVESAATRGEIDVRKVVWIGEQLLQVLVAAHAAGIVHRDIKPDNLFLLTNGTLKVLDFGIARLENDTSVKTTQAGRTMGTPVFMAPEQARGLVREVDAQSDVWAVGATLFRLLTGRFVFDEDTPELVVIAAATRPAPSLESAFATASKEHRARGHVSKGLAATVDKALAHHKQDRWEDAAAMLDALSALNRTALIELSEEEVDDETVTRLLLSEPTSKHQPRVPPTIDMTEPDAIAATQAALCTEPMPAPLARPNHAPNPAVLQSPQVAHWLPRQPDPSFVTANRTSGIASLAAPRAQRQDSVKPLFVVAIGLLLGLSLAVLLLALQALAQSTHSRGAPGVTITVPTHLAPSATVAPTLEASPSSTPPAAAPTLPQASSPRVATTSSRPVAPGPRREEVSDSAASAEVSDAPTTTSTSPPPQPLTSPSANPSSVPTAARLSTP